MRKIIFLLGMCLMLAIFLPSKPVYADPGQILRGVARTLGAAFEIPRCMLVDSERVMFPLGIVTGAVRGTVATVTGLVAGGMDIAQGGAPYAKYAAFFI